MIRRRQPAGLIRPMSWIPTALPGEPDEEESQGEAPARPKIEPEITE